MINIDDLIGKSYNKLTVISRASKPRYCNCLCECGNHKTVLVYSVIRGGIKSCGCLKKNPTATLSHGDSYSKEYICWSGIKSRCLRPSASGYNRYGGRGITICDSWVNSYQSFLKDMGRAPSSIHTIERIDNNKGYGPSNCRWATKKEQNNNRRTSRLILYKGKTQSLANWCEELDLNYATIRNRLHLRWPVEEAFETPLISIYQQHRYKKR